MEIDFAFVVLILALLALSIFGNGPPTNRPNKFA